MRDERDTTPQDLLEEGNPLDLYRYHPDAGPRPYKVTTLYGTADEIVAWHEDAKALGFVRCNAAYLRFLLNARSQGDLLWMDRGLYRLLKRLSGTLGAVFGELVGNYERQYLEGTGADVSTRQQSDAPPLETAAKRHRWESFADDEVDL